MEYFFFVLGFGLLILGAEILVRGASRLAGALGISPLVVGLTVVAFGTSAPEFAVSIQSSLDGQAALALGNVVGSNIFNVLFILGLSATITPLYVVQKLVRVDVPIMIGASCLVLVFSGNGVVSRIEGLLLFSGIVIYTLFGVLQSRSESREVRAEYREEFGSGASLRIPQFLSDVFFVLIGLGMLVVGSRWLVEGALTIARFFEISDLVIGLTVVAAGTSLPEVATSVVASLRGQRDIAVGNVVGSNVFNLLGVLGAAAVVSPEGIAVGTRALEFDIPIMVAVALACLPIFLTGHLIARWEGVFFFLYYLVYTAYLIAHATDQPYLSFLQDALIFFVIPLSLVTAVLLTMRFRGDRAGPPGDF